MITEQELNKLIKRYEGILDSDYEYKAMVSTREIDKSILRILKRIKGKK